MKALKVAAKELERIIKSRFIRVAVIVVAFMPLLYSFLYLYAFWDPYSKLDKLPVAVVNEDKGGISEGKETNFGDEIVKKLKEDEEFKWEFTDYKNAIDGLKGKKYYFAIVIPEDFTKNLLTVDSDHPKRASIEYITNDKKNFLATQIGNKAIESLQTKISNSIRKGYIDTIFKNLQELGKGLKEASEAENKLSAGSLELSNGVEKLSNNMNKVAKGGLQLKEGIYNLKEGLPQLLNGSEALYNGVNILSEKFSSSGDVKTLSEGAKSLTEGISKLNQGLYEASQSALKLKEGVSTLTQGYSQLGQNVTDFTQSVSQLGSGLKQMTESLALAQKALQEYIAKHPEEVNDPNLQKALFIIAEAKSGVSLIEENNLNKRLYQVQQLSDALSKLQQASISLNNGMDSLAAGLSYMTNASSQL
ncbi:MAG: YhgE/Pip domain-containing protein, partial [Caldanaerobacter sp.]